MNTITKIENKDFIELTHIILATHYFYFNDEEVIKLPTMKYTYKKLSKSYDSLTTIISLDKLVGKYDKDSLFLDVKFLNGEWVCKKVDDNLL